MIITDLLQLRGENTDNLNYFVMGKKLCILNEVLNCVRILTVLLSKWRVGQGGK